MSISNKAGMVFILKEDQYVCSRVDGTSIVIIPVFDEMRERPHWEASLIDVKGEVLTKVLETRPLDETLELTSHMGGDLVFMSREVDTWTSLLIAKHEIEAKKKIKGLNGVEKFLKSLPEYKRVFDEGFYLETTGGGGLGFMKKIGDTTQSYLLTSSPMSVFERPSAMTWAVSRTEEGSYDDGEPIGDREIVDAFIYVEGGNMDEMLDVYPLIPEITKGDEIERSYSSIEEFMEEHGTHAHKP